MAKKDRLDQPVTPRRMPSLSGAMNFDELGQFSEKIARFLGTGRYLFLQTFIVLAWVVVNAVPALQFDDYPYLFLTLALSLQASYAAPLILLAQNRQADRDRVFLEEDRAQYARNLADTEYLTRELAAMRVAIGDVVTRDFLRSELRSLLETLDEEAANKQHQERKERKKAEKKAKADAVQVHTAPAESDLSQPLADSATEATETVGLPEQTDKPDPAAPVLEP